MLLATKEKDIKERFLAMKPFLRDEQLRRIFAASEARVLGYGGIAAVSRITGIDREAISVGMKEIENSDVIDKDRIRKKGGGRKTIEETDPQIKSNLIMLLDSSTYGDPESPLKWTSKSLHNLTDALKNMGHKVSHMTVHRLLEDMDYSMQGNQKALEGKAPHPDRNEQFEHINKKAKEFQEKEQPIISVDAKKKELVGQFKNNGKEYCPKGQPEKVNTHDFKDKKKGKIGPYGVFDIVNNEGWISIGTDKDTAVFAVESIRRWWYTMGIERYSEANELLITADSGGSNGSRIRLWKYELQKLSDELGLKITVCHFPPGTSKWNKIEHRMFSYISQNWRGRPLISHEVIINLISSTSTKAGLNIKCSLDKNIYKTGIKVTNKEMSAINITRNPFHGDWNYTIKPTATKQLID